MVWSDLWKRQLTSSLLRHYLQRSQTGLRFWAERKAAGFFSHGLFWKFIYFIIFFSQTTFENVSSIYLQHFLPLSCYQDAEKDRFTPLSNMSHRSTHRISDVFIKKGILGFQVKIKVFLLTMKTKIMVLYLFMKDIIMTHDSKWWFTEIIQRNTFPWLKKFAFSPSNNDNRILTAFLCWQPKYQYSHLLSMYEGLIYEWFVCKRTISIYLDLEYYIL